MNAALPLVALSALSSPQLWTFSTSQTPTVELGNLAGDVVVRATDRAQVKITATVEPSALERTWPSKNADRYSIEVKQVGDKVIARVMCNEEGTCHRSIDVHLEAEVPRGTRLTANAVSADVQVRGVAEAKINSVSGDVSIDADRFDGEVSSVSGDVMIAAKAEAAQIKVNTTSGDVALKMPCGKDCRVRTNTVSGDLALMLPSPSAQLRFRSVSGDVHATGAVTVARSTSGRGRVEYDATVGKAEGTIEHNSVSGDLSIDAK